MGYDFPGSPTVGQAFNNWTWDGEKWVVSAVAPPSRAPFDALSYNGIQINGSLDVSQERISVGFSPVNGTPAYVADNWTTHNSYNTGAFVASRPTAAGFGVPLPIGTYQNAIALSVATAATYTADGNISYLANKVEGYRIARLNWGTSNAQPLSYAFWFFAARTGQINIWVTNSAGNRSYIAEKAVVAGWNFITGTIPGDTTGAWLVDNSVGLTFIVVMGALQTTPGVPGWQAGTKYYTAGLTNQFTAVNNVCAITQFILLPGLELPSSDRLPFIMRPFDQELQLCQRYFEKSYDTDIAAPTNSPQAFEWNLYPSNTVASGDDHSMIRFKVRKRAIPTVTIYSYVNSNASMISTKFGAELAAGSGTPVAPNTVCCFVRNSSGGAITLTANTIIFSWKADARL